MTALGQQRIFPDFKRQRARMVKLLEERGITDEAVLTAMRTVRRHLFVPEALQGRAYEEHALPHRVWADDFAALYRRAHVAAA